MLLLTTVPQNMTAHGPPSGATERGPVYAVKQRASTASIPTKSDVDRSDAKVWMQTVVTARAFWHPVSFLQKDSTIIYEAWP